MFLKLWYSVRDQSITHHINKFFCTENTINPTTGFVMFKMIIATVVILFEPLNIIITLTVLL